MLAGILNTNNLTRISNSYKFWRAIITITLFFGFSYFWWSILTFNHPLNIINGIPIPDEGSRLKTIIFLNSFGLLTLIVLIKRNYFSRLYFAVATCLPGISILLYLIFPLIFKFEEFLSLSIYFKVIFITSLLLIFLVFWKFFGKYSLDFWKSLIPFGSCKPFYLQAEQSHRTQLQFNSSQTPSSLDNTNKSQNFTRIIFYGIELFCLLAGQLFLIIGFYALFDSNMSQAIENRNIYRILSIILNEHKGNLDNNISPGNEFPDSSLPYITALLISFVFMFIFGFLRNQRRKEKIPFQKGSSSLLIPETGILLLRHSKDDSSMMPIDFSLTNFLWIKNAAFPWNYTLEEIIAKKLAFIGQVYALGSYRDKLPYFSSLLEKLKTKLLKLPPKLILLLNYIFKFINIIIPKRLPPLGSVRYYFNDDEWSSFVQNNIPNARGIILIIGNTLQDELESPHLHNELIWIKEYDCINKTIFILPPLVNKVFLIKKHAENRLYVFLNHFISDADCKIILSCIDAETILGICFFENRPIIITGSRRIDDYYKSTLEVASIQIDNKLGSIYEMLTARIE